MRRELKTAIKRKNRIYAKFIRCGRKQEDWDSVKHVQNITSRIIINAKMIIILVYYISFHHPDQV